MVSGFKGFSPGGSGRGLRGRLPARHPLPPQVSQKTPRVLRGCSHPGLGLPGLALGFLPRQSRCLFNSRWCRLTLAALRAPRLPRGSPPPHPPGRGERPRSLPCWPDPAAPCRVGAGAWI